MNDDLPTNDAMSTDEARAKFLEIENKTGVTFADIQEAYRAIDLEKARQYALSRATHSWSPKILVVNPGDPNTVKLRLQVGELMPDRTQYKPYGVTYNTPLWVEVTVSLDMVVDFGEEFVVLTPDGMAHVADQLATALDKMHDKFRVRDRQV